VGRLSRLLCGCSGRTDVLVHPHEPTKPADRPAVEPHASSEDRPERIELSANAVSDAGLEAFACCALDTGLLSPTRYVGLSDNCIRGVGCPSLVQILSAPESSGRLTELALSLNKVDNAGISTIADGLNARSLPTLHVLRLDSNRIGDEGVSALAAALERGAMAALVTLDLAGNRISDAGLASFVRAACERGEALSRLAELDLSSNRLGHTPKAADKGIATLAAALAVGHMPTLRTLKLSANRIGDRGATALALAGRQGGGKALRELWLCDNSIELAGLRALASVISDSRWPAARNRKSPAELGLRELSTLAIGGNPGAHAEDELGRADESFEAAVGFGPRAYLSLGDGVVIDGRAR
jgi:Ran GTPase-activating protein (RanGAP) involved in mRNA processing and transport